MIRYQNLAFPIIIEFQEIPGRLMNLIMIGFWYDFMMNH